MPNFDYTWTDEQIEEVNGRAIRIYLQLADFYDLPATIHAAVYQGVLNQCGQVEITQVARASGLQRMDTPGQR